MLKAGDKVRVRSWEDMEKEYGLDKDGDIMVEGCFLKIMKKFCGNEVTIARVYDSGVISINEDDSCLWSPEMFETVGSLLSANEVWKWLGDNYLYGHYGDVFGVDYTFEELCEDFTFSEIVKRVSDYVNSQRKPYNGNIVCTESESTLFTQWKKYEVKDGFFVGDSGKTYGSETSNRVPFRSFDEINSRFRSKFAKLIED